MNHAKVCTFKMRDIVCPLGCGHKINSNDYILEHYSVCPKALIYCDICTRNIARKDMEVHRADCESDPRMLAKDMAR